MNIKHYISICCISLFLINSIKGFVITNIDTTKSFGNYEYPTTFYKTNDLINKSKPSLFKRLLLKSLQKSYTNNNENWKRNNKLSNENSTSVGFILSLVAILTTIVGVFTTSVGIMIIGLILSLLAGIICIVLLKNKNISSQKRKSAKIGLILSLISFIGMLLLALAFIIGYGA